MGEAGRKVVVIGGVRTPFVRANGALRESPPLALATHAVNGLLEHTALDPAAVETLAFGIVLADARLAHFAREVVFASRLPSRVRALTLADNCITGTSAIALVHDEIASGRAEVGVAGGAESLSNPSLVLGHRATRALMDARAARGLGARLRALAGLRPRDLWPRPPAIREPSTGLTMGEHCELMVKAWGVGREEQDAIALRSHRRAHAATLDGRLTAEIAPLAGMDRDDLIRPDTSAERLARLAPVFDRSGAGTITAGNSTPLTDGAAAVLLMSEARARREGREPLARVRAFERIGMDPVDGLLMGPGVAVPRLLRRIGCALADFDLVEVHEAFAGQVACNLRAWSQGWKEPAIGEVDPDRLNVLGGSIAVGHPFAATGVRIVTTLANELARRDGRLGLASICGAGATASAMVLARD